MRKFLCYIGFHEWTWSLIFTDALALGGNILNHAKCKHCGTRYKGFNG